MKNTLLIRNAVLTKGSRRSAIAAALLGMVLTAHGMIFPLQKTQSGTYDTSQNYVIGFTARYNATGHALYGLGPGFVTTAIAPEWVITANHLNFGPGSVLVDDHNSYSLGERHQIGGVDIAIIKISPPLPAYSRLARSYPGDNNTFTIYGASPNDGGVPIVGSDGLTKGWSVVQNSYPYPPIRFGYGTVVLGSYITWPWKKGGPYGDYAPALVSGDSGGGQFFGTDLVGVNVIGYFELGDPNVRTSVTGTCITGDIVFDNSTLFKCTTTDPAASALQGGRAILLAPLLPEIYGYIGGSANINANGSPAVAGWTAWVAGTQYSNPSATILNYSSLSSPAPMDVYRSINYIANVPGSSLTYTSNNLIQYDSYRVRVHFSALRGLGPGKANEYVYANSQVQSVDPEFYAAYGTIVEFPSVYPTSANQIVVKVQCNNQYGNVEIAGIELIHN